MSNNIQYTIYKWSETDNPELTGWREVPFAHNAEGEPNLQALSDGKYLLLLTRCVGDKAQSVSMPFTTWLNGQVFHHPTFQIAPQNFVSYMKWLLHRENRSNQHND